MKLLHTKLLVLTFALFGLNISKAILKEHGFEITAEKLISGTKLKIRSMVFLYFITKPPILFLFWMNSIAILEEMSKTAHSFHYPKSTLMTFL